MSTPAPLAEDLVLPGVDLEAWSTRIRIVVTEGSALPDATRETLAWLDRVDRACSRFRDDSELSALNRSEGRPTVVGDVLLQALLAALEAATNSDGLVTPTVGEALATAGYDRTFSLLTGVGPADLPLPLDGGLGVEVADWREIEIDAAARTVRLPHGCRIDLGSTAKAWAADVLAAQLARDLGCGVLVDLGGDVVCAGESPPDGWVVKVVDGPALTGHGPLVMMPSGALATSSTVVRRWVAQGKVRHHIIDPRTGEPADDLWRTVTVSAARCLDANVASTAATILAADALPWLARVGLPARLVRRDGRVLTVNGWPADDEEVTDAQINRGEAVA